MNDNASAESGRSTVVRPVRAARVLNEYDGLIATVNFRVVRQPGVSANHFP
jgi:hypothetical protein